VRKGKSNAILTYELLAGFDNKLTTLVAQFDAFRSTLSERQADFQDHEARLRSLEVAQTALLASTNTSKGQWRDIWAGVIAVLALAMSLVNTIFTVFNAHLSAGTMVH
jgi:aspartate ammonia-lyase